MFWKNGKMGKINSETTYLEYWNDGHILKLQAWNIGKME
jgi:hypothetical protein